MEYEVKKCSVISGAPDSDIEFIKNHIDYSSYIICADSGYLKHIPIHFIVLWKPLREDIIK